MKPPTLLDVCIMQQRWAHLMPTPCSLLLLLLLFPSLTLSNLLCPLTHGYAAASTTTGPADRVCLFFCESNNILARRRRRRHRWCQAVPTERERRRSREADPPVLGHSRLSLLLRGAPLPPLPLSEAEAMCTTITRRRLQAGGGESALWAD